MRNYILTVSESGITIPPDIPKGHYKLVELTNTECKNCNLHKWQDIESYIEVTELKVSTNLNRIKNALRFTNYKYVEDFNDVSINDILNIRNIGCFYVGLIITICQIFSVNVTHVDPSYASLIEYYKNKISLKTN